MGDLAAGPISRVPGVRRIAVLRANALGDLVFALPALESLRAAYPEAEIVLLGRAWHRAFLARRPAPVDRVIPVPPGAIGDEPQRMDDARRKTFMDSLRAERFDIALQMHGGGRHSNPFVRAMGARLTAGPATPDAPPLDRVIPYVYYQSEYARCLEIVGLAGARPAGLRPRLAVTDADRADTHRESFVADVPVEEVLDGALDLLGTPRVA